MLYVDLWRIVSRLLALRTTLSGDEKDEQIVAAPHLFVFHLKVEAFFKKNGADENVEVSRCYCKSRDISLREEEKTKKKKKKKKSRRLTVYYN